MKKLSEIFDEGVKDLNHRRTFSHGKPFVHGAHQRVENFSIEGVMSFLPMYRCLDCGSENPASAVECIPTSVRAQRKATA